VLILARIINVHDEFDKELRRIQRDLERKHNREVKLTETSRKVARLLRKVKI